MKRHSCSILNRLLLLNGLAIIGVVANHATSWSVLAMFWWTDRYRPVAVPNYDMLGSAFHSTLMVLRKLTVFAVPSFLFVSGLFVTYMIRGRPKLSWKVVKTRIISLLIPYFVWSALRFTMAYVEGESQSLLAFTEMLVTGGAYWFIPLLCQMYLISPFLVKAAKRSEKALLMGSCVIALVYITLHYVKVYAVAASLDTPLVDFIITMPNTFLLRLQFFFVFGLVAGIQLPELRKLSHRFRWHLLGMTIVLAVLSYLEFEYIYHISQLEWWQSNVMSIPSTLYAISFIGCFVAFSDLTLPLSSYLAQLGKVSLGVYLLHGIVLEFTARVIQKFLPWGLSYHIFFYLTLVFVAIEGARFSMWIVARSPARRIYPYLFG